MHGEVPEAATVPPCLSGCSYRKAFSCSFKLMRVFYLFQPEIRLGGGYPGLSQCAPPHLHENGSRRGFSGTVSFSHNKTNCCLEKPSVSLETDWWGLGVSLLNLTPAITPATLMDPEWKDPRQPRQRAQRGRLGALGPLQGRGVLVAPPALCLQLLSHSLILKAISSGPIHLGARNFL